MTVFVVLMIEGECVRRIEVRMTAKSARQVKKHWMETAQKSNAPRSIRQPLILVRKCPIRP